MHIFFSGIGGVGIGPLAEIAHDAGLEVHGSDMTKSLVTQKLEERDIPIHIGQDGSFLQTIHEQSPIDWFVHTAALPDTHPELMLAKQLGIKTAKRDELLAHIIDHKQLKLIAVAGTHGKTTTTGMLVWTLQQLDVPISYSIGSTVSFGPSGKFDPASDYFVYECDEFDRNFLHFSPFLSLITSIGYDHPDTYPTKKSYHAAFKQFIDQSKQTIMWQSDKIGDNVISSSDWLLGNDEVIDISVAGAHNRRNATLVLKAIEKLEVKGDATSTLQKFPGTDRRFEKLANNLYSDYGHHPVEIAATLQLARELSDHVVLVYQPHQNIRQHELKDHYTTCFEQADEIYWLPTHLSREDANLPTLSPEELTKNITNQTSVHIAQLNEELWSDVETARHAGKLVLLMGAGSIDTWARERVQP